MSGTYELVGTDEGKKANLQFRALGEGARTGEPLELGINAHFRGSGAIEDSGAAVGSGGHTVEAAGAGVKGLSISVARVRCSDP